MINFKMFKRSRAQEAADRFDKTVLDMIDKTQATIRFNSDGTIVTANENFLNTLGYTLEEVVGRHHSMFLDMDYGKSEEYASFWADLAAGKSFTDKFRRLSKQGDVVWIQATYAPLFDNEMNVVGVMKIATDISERQEGVEEIARALDKLSRGNLDIDFKKSAIPDLRSIGDSFAKAVSQLSASISAVQDISIAVECTAQEVDEVSSELAKRTEMQAATLEETAAALEELTATVRNAAKGTSEVEASTVEAKKTAELGGEIVSQGIQAMSSIEASSSKIASIISVIEDIAFQTNILALNAGVEAARAGEAGRGFAVVASEVHSLAKRSSSAAGEIKSLIDESSANIASGVDLIGSAGQELEKIIEVVSIIANNVSEIAQGASEQAITLNEINTSVARLDAVTQQNASMVEETATAGQALASDASNLSRAVGAFRLGEPGDGKGDLTYRHDQADQLSAGPAAWRQATRSA